MSFIDYNGVTLTFIQTKRYAEEPIWLAQDTPGTRHTLTVLATVHAHTAGPTTGNAAGVVTPTTGPPQGVASWLAIHAQLMRPRRPFRFLVGPQVIAEIPPPAGNALDPGPARPVFPPVDIELGPKPLAANCVGFNGTGSMLVEYTIQWSMPNPCGAKNGVMAVLAHAWMSEDDIDEAWFMTRTYTGMVHFDPRVVGAASGAGGINPDQLRGLLLPPRTQGCYRAIQVKLSEDGYSMAYKCVDRQPHAFCNTWEVNKVVATQSAKTVEPGLVEQLRGIQGMVQGAGAANQAGVGNAMAQASSVTGPGSFFGDMWGVVGSLGNWIGGAAGFTAAVFSGVPMTIHTIEATAHGNPASRNSELARVARVIVLFRLMRGTLVGQRIQGVVQQGAANVLGLLPYGGFCEQVDTSEPKTSTIRLQIVTRPDATADANIWAAAQNTMFNSSTNREEEIKGAGPGGIAIPQEIRNIMFAGAIHGTPERWGWFANTFAPDLVGTDVGTRDREAELAVNAGAANRIPAGQGIAWGVLPNTVTLNNGNAVVLPRSTLVANALIAALQDPCAYKAPMMFTPRNGSPLTKLP